MSGGTTIKVTDAAGKNIRWKRRYLIYRAKKRRSMTMAMILSRRDLVHRPENNQYNIVRWPFHTGYLCHCEMLHGRFIPKSTELLLLCGPEVTACGAGSGKEAPAAQALYNPQLPAFLSIWPMNVIPLC